MKSDFDSKQVWKNALHAGLGSFIFGYNIGVFTSCQPCVSSTLNWGSSKDFYIPLMTAMMYIGGLFGALSTGCLKRYGRRKSIIFADFVNLLGVFIIVIPTTITFGIGRFVTGFSGGMFSSMCPLYINEKTPAKISGKVGGVVQTYACLGVLVAYGFALILPTENYDTNPLNYWWIGMFAFQGLVSLTQLILFQLKFVHDTPTSLVDRGLEAEAMISLLEIYDKDKAELIMKTSSGSMLLNGSMTSVATTSNSQSQLGYKELLCCKKGSSKMVRLGIMACVIQEFCGIIAILGYATTIFGSFGGGVFISRVLTFISGIVKTVSVVSALPFIDKWGRRPIYIIGSIFMGLFLFLIGVFSEFVTVFYIVPFLCIEGFLVAFEMSVGPVCWIYCGEILNPKGMSIAISANWVCMIATSFSFPYLIDLLGKAETFWLYAGFNLLAAIYSWADLVETKGLDKAQIYDLLVTKFDD